MSLHRTSHRACAKSHIVALAHKEFHRLSRYLQIESDVAQPRNFGVDEQCANLALHFGNHAREHQFSVDAAHQLRPQLLGDAPQHRILRGRAADNIGFRLLTLIDPAQIDWDTTDRLGPAGGVRSLLRFFYAKEEKLR